MAAAIIHQRKMQGTDPRQLRTPARVLTVLGQPVLAEVVRLALSHGQFQTRIAADEAEATAMLGEWQPHIAIIDMDISKGELLDRLSAATTPVGRIPVIALTRRGDLQTKLAAFDRGVDDILVVPFSPEELVARTLAVMRRTYREAIAFTPVIRLGELEVDILHRRVRSGSTELHLTSLEQSLLYLLAANAGRLVTREQILDNLWGVDYAAESNVVDRHVRNLRTKLQDDWRRPRFIATVPGRGYRFLPALTQTTA
ncbi:MAG TPA: response regulator transcription factor [Candidatus Dormibacteraeota bacterium]